MVIIGSPLLNDVEKCYNSSMNTEKTCKIEGCTRVGNIVTVWTIGVVTTGSNVIILPNLNSLLGQGFAPETIVSYLATGFGTPSLNRAIIVGALNTEGVKLFGGGTFWASNEYSTIQDWPTTLPGTAV